MIILGRIYEGVLARMLVRNLGKMYLEIPGGYPLRILQELPTGMPHGIIHWNNF